MPRIIEWKGPKRIGSSPASFSTAPQISSISPARARVGASVAVTILGSNFRNCALGTPPQVTFGGLPATSVVVVNSGMITCNSPIATAPGIVDLVVTVGCCS